MHEIAQLAQAHLRVGRPRVSGGPSLEGFDKESLLASANTRHSILAT